MNLFNLFNLFKSLNMTTFLKVVTPSSDPTAPPIEDFSKKYFAGRCRNSGNIIILDIGDNQKVPVVRDLTSSHMKQLHLNVQYQDSIQIMIFLQVFLDILFFHHI